MSPTSPQSGRRRSAGLDRCRPTPVGWDTTPTSPKDKEKRDSPLLRRVSNWEELKAKHSKDDASAKRRGSAKMGTDSDSTSLELTEPGSPFGAESESSFGSAELFDQVDALLQLGQSRPSKGYEKGRRESLQSKGSKKKPDSGGDSPTVTRKSSTSIEKAYGRGSTDSKMDLAAGDRFPSGRRRSTSPPPVAAKPSKALGNVASPSRKRLP
jgi:hypothetical protein